MPKRFTDTDKWKKQTWFRKLKPTYKLVFLYLLDACDIAGIWKMDIEEIKSDTGLTDLNMEDFVEAVNIDYDPMTGEQISRDRISVERKNRLWITGFVQFQYEGKNGLLNLAGNFTKSAVLLLKNHGLYEIAVNQGFIRIKHSSGSLPDPMRTPSVSHRDGIGMGTGKGKGLEGKESIGDSKGEKKEKGDFDLDKKYSQTEKGVRDIDLVLYPITELAAMSDHLIREFARRSGKPFHPSPENRRYVCEVLSYGYTGSDILTVFDYLISKWKGDKKMDQWLRPKTALGENFQAYLANAMSGSTSASSTRDADLDQEYERELKKLRGT